MDSGDGRRGGEDHRLPVWEQGLNDEVSGFRGLGKQEAPLRTCTISCAPTLVKEQLPAEGRPCCMVEISEVKQGAYLHAREGQGRRGGGRVCVSLLARHYAQADLIPQAGESVAGCMGGGVDNLGLELRSCKAAELLDSRTIARFVHERRLIAGSGSAIW